MRKLHWSLLIGLVIAASPALAADASRGSVSSDAKAVRATVKHDAKVFGVAVKHTAIKIGHAAKRFGLRVAAATKQGVHEMKEGDAKGPSDGKKSGTP